jgi:hypothetical protein
MTTTPLHPFAGRAALAAAAVALASAGCSGTSSAAPNPGATARTAAGGFRAPAPLPAGSPGPLPVTLPALSSVNSQDPSAVSQAAVTIMWTMDTALDTSQYQAELRAAPFLAPAYLASLTANPPVAGSGAQWTAWSAHRAYTTVAAVPERQDQPIDSPTQAQRQWGVSATPHGTGGWTGPPLTSTVFVTMTRAAATAPWRVSAVQVAP